MGPSFQEADLPGYVREISLGVPAISWLGNRSTRWCGRFTGQTSFRMVAAALCRRMFR
jgi:hypothetical protein